MNRVSLAFLSTLAACAAESSTPTPTTFRNGVAPAVEPTPGVVTQHPSTDPGCDPSSTMRQYGTAGEDAFLDVAVTADGEVLVTGYQGGILRPDGEIVASRGIVLEHDDAFWPRAMIDTLGTDSVESIAVAPDTGRVWLALRTNGDLPELPPDGGFDVVLGELTGTGASTYVRGFDGTSEYPRQIAAGTGVVAIAGHEERLMPDGSTWVNPRASAYDTSGDQPTTQWLLTRRVNPIERYTAVDIAGDDIALAGAIGTGPEQGASIALRSTDVDLRWQQQLATTGGATIAAVRFVEGGDLVWAGTSRGDIIAGRLDGATGAPLWTINHGDEAGERAADMTIDAHGRILIAGDRDSATSDDRDAFLLVLDDQGQPLSEEYWSSTGDDVPTAIAVDACGDAVIVGETTGDLAGESRGGTDGFVIRANVP